MKTTDDAAKILQEIKEGRLRFNYFKKSGKLYGELHQQLEEQTRLALEKQIITWLHDSRQVAKTVKTITISSVN